MNTNEVASTAEDKGKVRKAFDGTMRKLVAIVGGKEQLFPKKKVGQDLIATIVAGLVKDEKEAAEKEIKEKLQDILRSYSQMQADLKKAKEELVKLEEKKMKEFNEAAQSLFARIDKLEDLEKGYYAAMTAAGGEEPEAAVAQ